MQIEDVTEDDAYRTGNPIRRALADLGGARSALWVALRKDDALVGAFVIYRQEVRLFTPKQIELIRTFAAQAVIAMENARLITETREALEQQTATAEVLQVINSSPGDLTPVFDAVLEKAHSLCDAPCGSLQIFDGNLFRAVATRGISEAYVAILRQGVRGRTPRDAAAQYDFADRAAQAPDDPILRVAVDVAKLRTVLFVPLYRDGVLLGRIAAGRHEARPFTDKQIALLQNFAAQAVIAMENARLITETREALEQQTATAEVLGVINSSPGDLAPVFDAMLEKAMRLCGAAFGVFAIYDDEHYRVVANHGVPLGLAEFVRQAVPIHTGSMPDRLRCGEDTIQVADITALGSELRTPGLVAMIELGNARTAVWVALRKDGVAQGFFGVYRQEIRPFSDKQIALLQNFAAQAVIAMENARLITETHEALEQQTATAEVLQVINSSPGDLAPVFDAMLKKATRLCEAPYGTLFTYDGECFHAAAMRGVPEAFADSLHAPIRPVPGAALDRMVRGERFSHFADVASENAYGQGDPAARTLVELGGARTALAVPLRKDDTLLGVFAVYRQEVRPFSEKEIALVTTFADQAVIAIENARLLGELRERTDDLQELLEYQTATSDVLKVISQSTFDLRPVLETLARTASRLCEAEMAFIFRREGELYRVAASVGSSPETKALVEANPVSPGRGTVAGRTALTANVVHIPDARLDPEYTWGELQPRRQHADDARRALVARGGAGRRHRASPRTGRAFYRQADRIGSNLCRPGGDRDRECPARSTNCALVPPSSGPRSPS